MFDIPEIQEAIMHVLLSLVLLCILSLPIFAQNEHADHAGATKLGAVHFPISCGGKAQAEFDRAMALLHSFWYDEAEKTFAAIATAEPSCGMGWWGMAMSNYHPLWSPPTPGELRRGSEASEKAARTGAKTQRERDYIAAISTFYHDASKLDHLTRVLAYRKSMGQLHQRYPEDTEGSILYALSLVKQSPASSEDVANQKEAARILTSI
ncbi:MAG: hypothetical protein ACRD88_20505, partial [Terriglobia bacterium]